MSNQHSAYLKAIGIDVWVERNPSIPDVVNIEIDSSQQKVKNQQTLNEVKVIEADVSKPTAKSQSITKESETNIEALDWQALRVVVEQCQRCELSQSRTQTVFGIGKQVASLMIVGDAPNDEDDQQGEPFVGRTGKLLTAMLKAMGYQRNDVYISNIVKCRTKENAEPSIEEAGLCDAYLKRQIELLQPQLILALGSVTAQRLLKTKSTMGRLRGQLHYVEGIKAPIVVSYHPAYLLRAPNEKRKAWDDLQMAMKELASIESSGLAKE